MCVVTNSVRAAIPSSVWFYVKNSITVFFWFSFSLLLLRFLLLPIVPVVTIGLVRKSYASPLFSAHDGTIKFEDYFEPTYYFNFFIIHQNILLFRWVDEGHDQSNSVSSCSPHLFDSNHEPLRARGTLTASLVPLIRLDGVSVSERD